MLNISKMSRVSEDCDVEEFMQRPLVTWFHSCLQFINNKKNCTYEELVDGVFIHQVYLQMGLDSVESDVSPSLDEPRLRARNLRTVLANLRNFYEERGDVVLRAPRIVRLAREPRLHVVDAELLLCLMLGCAVQCPRKEDFIKHIQSLDVSTQEDIVNCIKQVVHMPSIVLSPDMLSEPSKELQLEEVVNVLIDQLRRVYRERSKCADQLRAFARDDSSLELEDEEELNELVERLATRQRDTELADCRAQVRRQRDDLTKAHEELQECREELRLCKESAAAVQKENEILALRAQSVELYRDELDATKERAEKADQLELEISRYKKKLASMESLKGQLKEFQEINQLLVENNNNLEERLTALKTKASDLTILKKELAQLQQKNEELELKNEAIRKRQRELLAENAELKTLLKVSTKEALETGFSLEPEEPSAFANSSLKEQMSNSAHCRALKLELENRQLSSLVDSLKESSTRGDGGTTRLLKLELENHRLSSTLDSLRDEQAVLRSPARPTDAEPRCNDHGHEKLQLRQLTAELRLRADELEAEKRAALERARDLEQQLEEAQRAALERARDLEQQLEEAQRAEAVRRSPDSQEHAQLREDFGMLFREYQRLLNRLNQQAKELEATRGRVLESDRQLEQLRLHCADLAREKRYLIEHSVQLAEQNKDLVHRMREDIERHCSEDRRIRDEMNNLNRHKEKLEEKIMDHYRRMPSSAGKKRSNGVNLVKATLSKMRRASTGFFNRSRRSWAEESSERSREFDFVRRHEPDGANEPRNRKSVDFLEDFRPSEFSFDAHLDERSRKSVDFMGTACANEPQRTDDDGEELHDEGKVEEDLSAFANNKSVDLSLEDVLEESEHEVPEQEALDKLFNDKNLRKAESQKSLWMIEH